MGAALTRSERERLGRMCQHLNDEIELKNKVINVLCSSCEIYTATLRDLRKQVRLKTDLPPQT